MTIASNTRRHALEQWRQAMTAAKIDVSNVKDHPWPSGPCPLAVRRAMPWH